MGYCINSIPKDTCYEGQIITTVNIPNDKDERHKKHIIQLILDFGGQIIDANKSKSVIIVFFPNSDKRNKFCDLVDNFLDGSSSVMITKPDSFYDTEGRKNYGEIYIDFKDMFKEFYSLLKKMNPIIDSIFHDGELINEEELLKYCDRIKSDKDLGNTSESMKDAINNFLSFMGKYTYGNQNIELTVDFFGDDDKSPNRLS